MSRSRRKQNHKNDSLAEEEEENPYLAMRQAKIARNQARLKELGLLKAPSHLKRKVKPQTTISSNAQQQQQYVNKPRAEPTRRSRRLSQQPQRNYTEETLSDRRSSSVTAGTKRPLPSANEELSDTYLPETPTIPSHAIPQAPIRLKKTTKTPNNRAPPAPNSVRGISLNVETLILGPDNSSTNTNETSVKLPQRSGGLLGMPMPQTGKECVIYEAFARAASPEDKARLGDPPSRLSFNKYSGVQEWEDCVFLWVNLGGKNNTVFNEFLDGGHQITWFGGSRMVGDSPIVLKLIQWGKEAMSDKSQSSEEEVGEESSKLILFCRRFEEENKKFGPYVCLGRLAYESHQPNSYPLSFVWKLIDADRLLQHNNKAVRDNFQLMMDSA